MTVLAHIDALQNKHTSLESGIREEQSRPMPDFGAISDLKKRKLLIKQEIQALQALLPRRQHG